MKFNIRWLFLAATILYIVNTFMYQRLIDTQRRLITTQANTITKLEAGMDRYQHWFNLMNDMTNGPARTNNNR